MNPIGSYHRVESELWEAQQKLGLDACITFGILFADVRQSEAKEYIVNYLNRFDKTSGEYFDFFIPGYVEDGHGKPAVELRRTNQCFFFDAGYFDEFCDWSEKKLGIEYTYNPMLALISVQGGRLGDAKKIVVELDGVGDYGVKRSGMLFDKIFEIAKRDNALEEISKGMKKLYIKGNLTESIVKSLGQGWLEELKRTHDGIQKFKINRL